MSRVFRVGWRILPAVVVASVMACSGVGRAAESGLDVPEPIGAFLDGVFPSQAPGGSGDWAYEQVFTGIEPKLVTCALPVPGTNRILIVEKQGRILTFENRANVDSMELFLDYREQTYSNSDSGMSHLVFHPEFGQEDSPNRGYVYVTYKHSPNGDEGDWGYWRLSRFTVPDGALVADPASEQIMIQLFDRHQWHDSGCMMFGPDGYLYVAIGDEGGADDQFNSTQKLDDMLYSGMLRIDVDEDPERSHPIRRQPRQNPEIPIGWPASFTAHYGIPKDNPWVNEDGSVLEEFYAIGLRSPYRFSRDPVTGRVWIGDVGEAHREEVSELVKGGNFEWSFREGTVPGPKPMPDALIGTRQGPLWDYARTDGFAVILGYFYHGAAHPDLRGKCLAADYVSGKVWAITPGSDGGPVTVQHLVTLSSSGTGTRGTTAHLELPDGEPLILKVKEGDVAQFFKLTRTGVTIQEPPLLLSETGAFTDLATLTPREGLIPYTVNAPLWSDGAGKRRWLAVPNDGTHDTEAEKIAFSPETDWKFPVGTVFVKHFELGVDENDPAAVRKLETRFLVMSETGEPYGVTYRWREDGSDADLLPAGEEDVISIALAGGGTREQVWEYPNRTSCMTCHNRPANHVLGVKTHQLNGDMIYPRTGRTGNQLETLAHLGMFDAGYRAAHLPYFLRASPINDLAQPAETRVRSYLDSNCAQCHRPGGVRANFDARFTTPLEAQGLLHGELDAAFTGEPEAVIQPGDPGHSVAYLRTSRVGVGQMPPIAKNVVDIQASDAIRDWIESLAEGPSVTLGVSGFTEEGDTFVSVRFTNSVTGFDASDVRVRGGEIVELGGTGNAYTVRVRPVSGAPMQVRVPAGVAFADGLGNYASARLEVEPVPTRLVSWLKFDAKSGVTVRDHSLNADDGSIAGQVAWVNGHIAGGLKFNGGRVTIPNNVGDDFTISFWMRADAPFPRADLPVEGATLFFADAPFAAEEFLVAGTRSAGGVNRVNFQTGSSETGNRVILQGGRPVSVGVWTHVAVRRIKATREMKLYVNGQVDAAVFGGGEDLTLSPNIEMGATAAGASLPFNGAFDQVRIFDRALSDAEIQNLAAETWASTVSPIADWFESNLPGLTHLHDPGLDPDGDGVDNGGEFSFGTNPLRLDVLPIDFAPGGDGMALSFPVRKEGGLEYDVMVSFDLVSWEPAGDRFRGIEDSATASESYKLRTGTFVPGDDDPKDAVFLKVVPQGEPR